MEVLVANGSANFVVHLHEFQDVSVDRLEKVSLSLPPAYKNIAYGSNHHLIKILMCYGSIHENTGGLTQIT